MVLWGDQEGRKYIDHEDDFASVSESSLHSHVTGCFPVSLHSHSHHF